MIKFDSKRCVARKDSAAVIAVVTASERFTD